MCKLQGFTKLSPRLNLTELFFLNRESQLPYLNYLKKISNSVPGEKPGPPLFERCLIDEEMPDAEHKYRPIPDRF